MSLTDASENSCEDTVHTNNPAISGGEIIPYQKNHYILVSSV